MSKKSNADYCREYRQRLKENPDRLAVYRSGEAARRRRLRRRVPTDVPTDVPTVSENVPTDSPDPYSLKAIKEREESIRESCSEDYQQIMESSFFDGTSGSGGLHSPSENQGRSFSGDESCLRTPEAIEREWHSIWGVTDGH